MRGRTCALWAAAIVIVVSFGFIGTRSIWSTDEGRYTAVALEMMRTGDWMHPGFNMEEGHYTKPPITYWALAASMKLFGTNEWAARLPGGMAFAITCLAVGLLASRLAPVGRAVGAAAYAVTILPALASNVITTDTILTMWEILALLAFSRAWAVFDAPQSGGASEESGKGTAAEEAARRWPIRLMWLAFGFAFMTKGPPGIVFVVPFAVIAWKLAGWRGFGRLFDPLGLTLFAVSGLWWFADIMWSEAGMSEYFLVNEVADRLFTSTHHRNAEFYKAFYYFPILAAGLLPWSAAWIAQKPWRRGISRTGLFRIESPAGMFLAWTTWLPFAFFFLAKSRQPLYILPLFSPALVGIIRTLPQRTWQTAKTWKGMAAIAALICLARLVAGNIEDKRDMKALMAKLDVPDRYSEIVFVDRRPMYGLSFYAGVNCETVQLAKDMNKETLASELDDYPQGKTILLVIYPQDEAAVRDMLQVKGWSATHSRRHQNYLSLHVTKIRAADPEARFD